MGAKLPIILMNDIENKLNINPWTKICSSPRKTIRTIVEYRANYRFVWISFLYGILLCLSGMQSFGLGAKTGSTWLTILISLVLATLVGYIAMSVSAFILKWIGYAVGGRGKFVEVRAAVAWAKVPQLYQIIGWVVLLFIYGINLFQPETMQRVMEQPGFAPIHWILLLEAILGLWSFILLLHTLGEVHGFSAWMALLVVVVKWIIIAIVFTLIGWGVTSTFYSNEAVVGIGNL